MAVHLSNENIWFDQYKFMDAERDYYCKLAQRLGGDSTSRSKSPLIEQISNARQQIHRSLTSQAPASNGGGDASVSDISNRLTKLELENADLRQVTNDLQNMVTKLTSRIDQLEKGQTAPALAPASAPAAKPDAKKPEKEEEDDDDDMDLFGSDDDEVDEEAERIKAERLAAYAAKKSKKAAVIAKSSVLLDVKPWDDETDMKEMERLVRTIEKDGLVWGQALLKPLAYGICKLTINCVVEDDKVSIEELSEEIEAFEDHVQSVDVAAFNKI